jgi:CxxC-x17-CxxC domain-containing protein
MEELTDKITAIAETNFRNQRKRFGIRKDDRRRHVYLIGKTGMGKSTVLENMIIQDIKNGEGVAVVDPHGDLVEKVIDYIPSNRINDVIYFNPADLDFPIAFNVFEKVGRGQQHLVASGLIGIFKKLWADSWGPRLEYVLRNAILALLEYPDSTLLGVMRLLVDKGYRKKVVQKVTDPVVRAFWIDEYSKYPDKFQTEAIAPIQNKVGQFLSSPVIRNIVGQVNSSFNIRDIMDDNKVLLMNLAKGRIGEDNSALLGAMLITKIQMAAMSRVDVAEEERRDFYLYVDEFQNFATESFANILSEARKYRLNLIIAHQYIEQLDEKVEAAVFGNVGTIMCFRVGASDAESLVREFDPYFTEEDLVNLGKYDVYMRLMIDGVASQPFSATTLPPIEGRTENKDKIINITRERYAVERRIVEDKISRWSDSERLNNEEARGDSERVIPRTQVFNKTTNNRAEYSRSLSDSDSNKQIPVSKEKETKIENHGLGHTALCDVCGQEAMLSFVPDGKRPVYCKECLKKIRSGEIPPIVLKKEEKQEQNINRASLIPKPPVLETGDSVSISDALSKGIKNFKD